MSYTTARRKPADQSSNPDVFIHRLEDYPGVAIIFRDLMTRLNNARPTPIEQPTLEAILASIGGVGMMAVVGQRHRRIVVFAPGSLELSPQKKPLPGALALVSREQYPLG